jgi:hypothetical protein
MELTPLIAPLEQAIANPVLSKELQKLADSLSSNIPHLQVSSSLIEQAKTLTLLKKEGDLAFTSLGVQSLFYAIHFVREKIDQKSTDEEVIAFVKGLGKNSYPKLYANTWYQLNEIIYLVLNRIYGHDWAQYIADRKLYSRSIFHTYWELMPYLNSSPPNLVNALFMATQDIKAEGNYINLNRAVRLCAKNNLEFAIQLLESCKATKHKLDLFFTYTFLGLSENIGIKNAYTYLQQMLTSENKDCVIAGLRAFAWLHGNHSNPIEIESEITPILEELESRKDDELTSNIILAYGLLINKVSNARPKLISLISEENDQDSRFMLSHLINLNMKTEQEEEWFKKAMDHLINLKGQHVGTYGNLSNAFAYAFDKPPELFYIFMDRFISEKANDIKMLEGFRDAFERSFSEDKNRFEKWLTLSFNNEERRYHQAAREVLLLIDGKKSKDIYLSRDIIKDLTPLDMEFILYKIVGNIYSKENLQSLTYSALEYIDGTGFVPQIVTELFSMYIIYNYPASINYLKDKIQNANEIQTSVIKSIEQHYNEAHRIKRSKPLELTPSPARQQKMFKRLSDQMIDFKDESPFKRPRIIDFVTNVSVLKGSDFFHRDGKYERSKDKYKSKSEMRKISVEMDMPGGEFVDPIGQEFNRHYWRTIKRRTQ